jgi:hypothetical protein
MIHGVVPRFTRCPPAFCAPTKQAEPLTREQLEALRQHQYDLDAKSRAASERMTKIQLARWNK